MTRSFLSIDVMYIHLDVNGVAVNLFFFCRRNKAFATGLRLAVGCPRECPHFASAAASALKMAGRALLDIDTRKEYV
jgi:hypothetical protein